MLAMAQNDLLARFLKAMEGEWVVDGYSVDDNGKLRVRYVSKDDPALEWSHCPDNPLATTPKIGDVGMLGFLAIEQVEKIRTGEG